MVKKKTVSNPRPLIDTARVSFGGMSEEAFEALGEENIGDIRYFTVKVRVKSFNAVDMAESGVRRAANCKILKVVEGVSEAVKEEDDGQGSMLDDDGKVPDVDPDEKGEPESENVTPIKAKAAGPQFSGGDDE
ncbi:hypothetical protein CH249_01970 [Rhodococcus sp. 05-2255-3B1]|uniref:hypothetical protein n=1 Tax=unclassified Rhodococcus (in: high G+C Gram-positive bacteria) TaxID=192944 RepID=UPI000B9A9255|nr:MULTISPECIES: hypothetical protein [unclassified Rhodococcus (in: high G+C Gram-positive bacteria)]OZE13350.1 hypothetical protein CH250_05395 [Rhodococcus sp. 05-2255-3C]OZE16038.1 hypothetical protein CH249_01970 [Rhodococcus sp. 05-2255-3B1]OZE19078.1 hypothetical protein CH255_13995 [Rhodococcus sp. 05-2255-2A2]